MDQRDIDLPVLRPDIEIHSGPPTPDGSPTFTVYDPLNRTFDKVGWTGAEILVRLRAKTTLTELMDRIVQETTLRPAPEEVLAFCREAESKGLTRSRPTRTVKELLAEFRRNRVDPVRWLLHHYLYFRVPLLKPDGFLERTLPLVAPLASGKALILYALLAAIGLVMCVERFQEYLGTFPYFFNWQGLAVFGLVVALIKTVHEFSHAYTAKARGLRVPTMGVAFIVMWPVAFCDVTDAWKIKDRRKRLAITFAGVKAELAIAGLALFGWGMTGAGLLHGIFFVISSSSLLSTLLININPAMRFDGYFLLMDLCGIDNLQPRAFALTRWACRRWLLGTREPHPDPEITGGRFWAVIAYSFYTWAYRLTLYMTIAVLVYHKFLKILGIFLFLVEVWWFILGPILRETKALLDMRQSLAWNRRTRTLTLVLAAALLWYAVPLPHEISAPAVLTAVHDQVIYAPFSGEIHDIAVSRGAEVKQGAVLSRITSDKLDADTRIFELEKRISEKKLELFGLDDQNWAYIPQQTEEIADARARLAGLHQQKEQSRQVAKVGGVLYEWDDTLRDGMAVKQLQVLGRIADFTDLRVYAFVSEDRVMDLLPQGEVEFYPDDRARPLSARIASIHPVRTENMEYLGLTSAAEGSLPVVNAGKGKLAMLESYYAVEAKVDTPAEDLRIGQSGLARLQAKSVSRLAQGLRRIYRVLIREMSF
ncbi:efflux RND transporter periplasmic adaptor subunit [Fundidesulfovibrio butyratiphilus]